MSQNPDSYSVVLATSGLATLERQAILLSKTLEADGATFQASEVRRAFFRLLDELKLIAREISARAEDSIKDEEIATQVRGSSGQGASLNDHIGKSSPLHAVEGSVGINDEDYLASTPVHWWWTNEEGYSGHVGRRIHGFFTPSGDRPLRNGFGDTGFTPASRANGGGPGVIKEAIPARRFVRDGAFSPSDGSPAPVDVWHKRIREAKAAFLVACESAVASAPPPKPKGGPGGRRRR